MTTPGLYNLLIHLERRRRLRVGRLGVFDFPPGYYVYTGSAMGGLEARIQRHLREEKPLRWHIDYLLRFAKVIEVHRYPADGNARGGQSQQRTECALSDAVANLPGCALIAPRFGSSDCRCAAHLAYFGEACPTLPLPAATVAQAAV